MQEKLSSFIKAFVGPDGKLHTPEKVGMKKDLAALKQEKEVLERTRIILEGGLYEAYEQFCTRSK